MGAADQRSSYFCLFLFCFFGELGETGLFAQACAGFSCDDFLLGVARWLGG